MSGTVQDRQIEARQRIERWALSVRGIVQGVGFRPFIYTLAHREGLTGSVSNDEQGVIIEVEGSPDRLARFLESIRRDAPPLAAIEAIACRTIAVRGDGAFRIEESRAQGNRLALIAPDVATCDACLAELFDPSDRRHRYPFTNCTNCGPRFTITCAVPYDRATTTMVDFTMCAACRAEYEDPRNRRFHAQPNACPVCGPRVSLVDRRRRRVSESRLLQQGDAIAQAADLLRDGAILAVKGLGGYHLACDPLNRAAASALRVRKGRQDKPFALMARSLDEVRALCHVGEEETRVLLSPARPVVLLQRREDAPAALDEVAPRQKRLGVMLAYTPLHHLLLADMGAPLVMTSGNRTDEPIAYRDEDAFEHLGEIAEYFLIHDRPIHMRCDDSVVLVRERDVYPVRRSRGYAPAPLTLREKFEVETLACGGELKNTFCLARGRHAFLSHHIGDLENYETLRSFREGIEHYCRTFDIRPRLVAHDLHPEYLSTKYAAELEEEGFQVRGIQHHHAHIASCLADNERPGDEQVIGVAMDGTGYGIDGAIWGGEFLVGGYRGFTRRAHLAYVPLPGGEAAIRQPWRMALAYLLTLHGEEKTLDLPLALVRQVSARDVHVLAQILRARSDSPWLAPPTSSAGRLFDAVAALCDLPGSQRVTYEGQAAVELELAAGSPTSRVYPFAVLREAECWTVQTDAIIGAIVEDLLAGRPAGEISAAFHRTMVELIAATCAHLREETGLSSVALSGGTFQNMLLLNQTVELLTAGGFTVYTHRRVPANDAGLSLGQAVLAANAPAEQNISEGETTCV